MSNNILTIKEYFDNKTFAIPHYQRGYKWSAKEKDEDKSSVHFFCESIKNAYINNKKADYFIEAVTVVQENKTAPIILVDGQQRTTTLYLIFIVLGDFDFLKDVILDYKIRKDSDEYLKYLLASEGKIESNTTVQDIFYFNEAIETIKDIFNEFLNDSGFKKFIKNNVKLLFNTIPASKAVNTFIALNGLKAIMKDEELIKSDILIQSSRPLFEISGTFDREEEFGFEWKINEDRGRLARNWDKWLYWWNQQEVRDYFGIGDRHPLYFLLVTYWKIESEDSKKSFDFQNFKNEFISSPRDAKNHFEGLRKLQKTFEDLYNNPESFNLMGIILKTSNSKEEALHSFLDKKNESKLAFSEYAKWSLVNATHLEIINNTKEINSKTNKEHLIKMKKAISAIDLLNEKFVYWDENDAEYNDSRKEFTFRFLMYLNLLEDTNLKRKFDFSIWNNRSLEHIYPKSKKSNLDFEKTEFQEGSIHCIGNLVLLYGKDNSAFGAKDFEDKKQVYFNTGKGLEFKSRNLIHTLSVFANSEWDTKDILANKKKTINILKAQYGIN